MESGFPRLRTCSPKPPLLLVGGIETLLPKPGEERGQEGLELPGSLPRSRAGFPGWGLLAGGWRRAERLHVVLDPAPSRMVTYSCRCGTSK